MNLVNLPLSQILKQIRTDDDHILVLNSEEKKALSVYIKSLEKIIDTELK